MHHGDLEYLLKELMNWTFTYGELMGLRYHSIPNSINSTYTLDLAYEQDPDLQCWPSVCERSIAYLQNPSVTSPPKPPKPPPLKRTLSSNVSQPLPTRSQHQCSSSPSRP